jgi:hypothetical protein
LCDADLLVGIWGFGSFGECIHRLGGVEDCVMPYFKLGAVEVGAGHVVALGLGADSDVLILKQTPGSEFERGKPPETFKFSLSTHYSHMPL